MIDMKNYDGYVVKKMGEFFMAVDRKTKALRWSTSPWDGYSIKRKMLAKQVAKRVNGEICLFNPISGKLNENV